MASIRLRDVGRDDDFLGHGVSRKCMDVVARRLDEGRNSLRDGGQRGAHRDERRTTEGRLIAPWLRTRRRGTFSPNLSSVTSGTLNFCNWSAPALYVDTHHYTGVFNTTGGIRERATDGPATKDLLRSFALVRRA